MKKIIWKKDYLENKKKRAKTDQSCIWVYVCAKIKCYLISDVK